MVVAAVALERERDRGPVLRLGREATCVPITCIRSTAGRRDARTRSASPRSARPCSADAARREEPSCGRKSSHGRMRRRGRRGRAAAGGSGCARRSARAASSPPVRGGRRPPRVNVQCGRPACRQNRRSGHAADRPSRPGSSEVAGGRRARPPPAARGASGHGRAAPAARRSRKPWKRRDRGTADAAGGIAAEAVGHEPFERRVGLVGWLGGGGAAGAAGEWSSGHQAWSEDGGRLARGDELRRRTAARNSHATVGRVLRAPQRPARSNSSGGATSGSGAQATSTSEPRLTITSRSSCAVAADEAQQQHAVVQRRAGQASRSAGRARRRSRRSAVRSRKRRQVGSAAGSKS